MRVPTPFGTVMARMFVFFFIINMLASIHAFALQEYGKQKVTIIAENISIEDALRQIEKQTGMRFMYATSALNFFEKIKASYRQIPLDEVLADLLGSKGIIWQYKEGNILLKNHGGIKVKDGSKNYFDWKSEGVISGKITDINGTPIPGATVIVKGTKKGTKTNADGSFKLEGVDDGAVLIITSVGFETKELSIKNKEQLQVKMKMAIGVLDEAIVIAYGKTSGRTSTENISIIRGEEIAKNPVSNPLLALSGRVPGLNINQVTGYSGSGVVTVVQGQNSILRGNDPFYVVDGVPYPSQQLSVSGAILGQGSLNSGSKGSTLNFLNPNDIESITVLKDADATAIYGSRAANGAILITTKKGKQGKTKVLLDYARGFSKVGRRLDLMDTKKYLDMRHEALRNDGKIVGPTDYDLNGTWDTTRNIDWQKELIGKTAHYTNINGSFSGGSNNVQYLIGGTFHKETTVIPGAFNDQKSSVHFSINGNSDENKFQIQLLGNYLVDNNRLPMVDITNYITTAPDAPKLYNEDGTINFSPNTSGSSTFRNPVADLNNKYRALTKNLVSNLVLGYEIMPGLNIKSSFGYTDLQSDDFFALPLTAYAPELLPFVTRIGNYGQYNIKSWIIEPQISYNRILGSGKLDILLGSSLQQNQKRGNQVVGFGYNTDDAINNMAAAANIISGGVTSSDYKYAGIFGRFNYILNDKYIINISARRDGSSRFGPANRFHNFAALGTAWIFSSEDLIKNNIPILSYGKLRFSYGTSGNDQIDDYLFYNLYKQVVVQVPYRGITSLTSSGIFNPYLQWELTKKINFGIDLGFLKDRIVLNANYFVNRSTNQLLSYLLPSITGVNSVTTNIPATVQNSGLEFTLNGALLRNSSFNWSINANLTIPRNKLVKYENLESSSFAGSLFIGKSINVQPVFKYAGVDAETGVYQFQTNKGEITSTPNWLTDRTDLIDLSPKWYAGIGSSVSFKGISLDVLFQLMNRIAANDNIGYAYPGRFNTNQPTFLQNRWTKPGELAPRQRLTTEFDLADAYGNAAISTQGYSNAAYCRLKNISISWQVPNLWLKFSHISNIRIYAQGQNILTITNYNGLDPESLSSSSLPPLRTFVFGLQVGL
jgi:TonB-linked SusC/RagA family outer membrane protein